MKLYDKLMMNGFGIHERARNEAPKIRALLDRAVVVYITNVWEYYHLQKSQPLEWSWARGDFPNVAPPWKTFFMEYGEQAGCLFDALYLDGFPLFRESGEVIDGAAWLVKAFPYVRLDGDPKVQHAFVAEMQFLVSKAGERLEIDSNGDAFLFKSFEFDFDPKDEEMMKSFAVCEFLVIFPCFLAISFAHCKNVGLEAHEPKPSRAQRRRGDTPPVRYHTLTIGPITETLKLEGQVDVVGLKRALHICRGHFADYTEGRGLFGKYHGTFWMPMHARGNAERGEVRKTMNLLPASDEV